MQYVMKPFDEKSIDKTCSSWLSDLDTCTSIFPADVTGIVEYIQSNSIYDDATLESIAYGIFAPGKSAQHQAVAVVKVIISKAGRRWIKMIDCHVRPKIEEGNINGEADDIEAIADIYAAAITGTIALTSQHKVGTVKVYGRSNTLLHVLTVTAHLLGQKVAAIGMPVKVTIEGRWLVVKASK